MRWPRGRLRVEGILIAVLIVALAALDWAFLSAYRARWLGQPLRGLAGWSGGAREWEIHDALVDIAVQNVITLIAALLVIWVGRRISRGRGGVLVYLAIALMLFLLLVDVPTVYFMLNVIGGNGPP